MTRFFSTAAQDDDGLNSFVTDLFTVTTIALASVLGLLTIAATI